MTYPVMMVRGNGDRVVGEPGLGAEALYAAGTPPMHGFAARRPVSARVSEVRIGDQLTVERRGGEWVALDSQGVVGHLRWRPGDDGQVHAVTGVLLRLPARGTLQVRRLVVGPDGKVKDVGGEVTPTEAGVGHEG